MIRRMKEMLSGSFNKLSESHLKRVHSKMALASLLEHSEPSKLTNEETNAIHELWKPFRYKGKGEWHRLYKTVNAFDTRYVPNDVYGLELLPRLNTMSLLAAWDDKSYYPRFFPEIKQANTIAFVIDGLFYNHKYADTNIDYVLRKINDNYDRIIIKPSDGLEGRGVELIDIKQYDNTTLKEKLLSYGQNYVVQEVLDQHESLAIYNRSSVNPIRVMTLRLNGKIHCLHSTLRFGLPGAHTDINFIDGKEIAHVCAISKQGNVSDTWYDIDGKKGSVVEMGISEQVVIPDYTKIVDTAIKVHEGLQHFDLVGCDITLNNQREPVLIEYNVYWPGIILPQYCHGPLFGELTEELIFQLKDKPKK